MWRSLLYLSWNERVKFLIIYWVGLRKGFKLGKVGVLLYFVVLRNYFGVKGIRVREGVFLLLWLF